MEVKVIKISDILKCPTAVFLASHYRADGSCRHDELICEQDDCLDFKFGNEIYCKTHLREMYGDEFEEVEG